MSFPLAMLPLLVVAGGLAGFVNTVAGGGSLFTFPLLVLLGFAPQDANGTIRVTIILQNLVAVPAYAREGYAFPRSALALGCAAIPGALAGALVAARLDADPFRNVAALLLVLVLSTLFLNPKAWLRREAHADIRWARTLLLMVAVGFYGGFFQIGVGVLFLTVTVLVGGWDLVTANSLKVAVVLLYTVVSLLVFAAHGQVDWTAGAALGVGNMAGAALGARSAVRKGPGWIRWIIAAMVAVGVVRLLFFR